MIKKFIDKLNNSAYRTQKMQKLHEILRRKGRYIKYTFMIIAVIVAGCVGMSQYNGNNENEDLISISSGETAMADNQTAYAKASEGDEYYIYVCGAVANPGVYCVEKTFRIYQVIELAGGFAENAEESYLNLVEQVSDGQKLYVPYKGENSEQYTDTSSSRININTAGKEQLMTLPGIGESKAVDIIRYRQNNGRFTVIEDIMNISGIKENAFEKLKDLICV